MYDEYDNVKFLRDMESLDSKSTFSSTIIVIQKNPEKQMAIVVATSLMSKH